jgi:hypothetical protein
MIQSQLQQPTEVALRFDDPSGSMAGQLPGLVSVPPMGSSVVSVRVRPKKRRWFGERTPRTFMVTADGSSGGVPPISATGQMDDLPLGPMVLGGGVVGALAIAAFAGIAAASFLGDGGGTPPVDPTQENGGGGGGDPTVFASTTAEPTRRGPGRTTPVPSATTTATGPTATATQAPPTPTPPLPTPTPPPPPPTPTAGPPTNAANTGSWTLTLTVSFNNCPFGQFVGSQIEETYEFYEAVADDTYMEPGEAIDAYQSRTDAYLGQYTFSYPLWSISYEIVADDGSPGTAWLYNSFTALNRTVSQLEEYYTTSAGACQITYE